MMDSILNYISILNCHVGHCYDYVMTKCSMLRRSAPQHTPCSSPSSILSIFYFVQPSFAFIHFGVFQLWLSTMIPFDFQMISTRFPHISTLLFETSVCSCGFCIVFVMFLLLSCFCDDGYQAFLTRTFGSDCAQHIGSDCAQHIDRAQHIWVLSARAERRMAAEEGTSQPFHLLPYHCRAKEFPWASTAWQQNLAPESVRPRVVLLDLDFAPSWSPGHTACQ